MLTLAEPADRRFTPDPDLPQPGWRRVTTDPAGDIYPSIVIPSDTPEVARLWLAHIDAQTVDGARHRYGTISDEARLAAAGYALANSPDAEVKFFAHHWMRLFALQAEARRDGKPLPEQTWAMPDWVPGGAS